MFRRNFGYTELGNEDNELIVYEEMQKNPKKEKLPWRTAFQALNLTLLLT